MKIGVWEYQDPTKQVSYFRGYVSVYKGQTVEKIYSPEVRTSRLQAEKDAKKILKHEQSRVS